MKKDLISVVIPIYNVEQYLRKCIDTILVQTYSNLEIILVDDGSPDNCGKICDEYAEKDNRIKIIHKKNGGLSDARNQGIRVAKGKYITFIDSDDYVERDYIEYLYNLIKKYKTKMSICSYFIDIEPKKRINFGHGYSETLLNTEEALSRMLCEKGFSVSAWAKLYETSLFKNVKYPIGKLCEDNGTTYKLIKQCQNIAYGNECKYMYVQRNNSIMNSKFNLKKLDLIELTDIMARDLLVEFPKIKDSIIKKKINARFSILRQIVVSDSKENYRIAKKIKKELNKYWRQFFINSKLDFRDRIAFISLCFGLIPFKYCCKVYLKIKKG